MTTASGFSEVALGFGQSFPLTRAAGDEAGVAAGLLTAGTSSSSSGNCLAAFV